MKIGVIVRAFARTPELVSGQVQAVGKLIDAFEKLISREEIKKIDVVVPINQIFVDVDCGQTKKALEESTQKDCVRIYNTQYGLFCGLLNEAMARQIRDGCTHSLIVSTGCVDYVTEDNIKGLTTAANDGAIATGLAIGELSESILSGRIANTFAMWNIEPLLAVGGFDLRAENAQADNRIQPFMRGKSTDGKDVFYPLAGVEEIIPLVRLVEMHDKCIKPVVPTSGLWKAPNPVVDPVGFKRHVAKMATKFERQSVFAHQVSADFSFIEGGVMG